MGKNQFKLATAVFTVGCIGIGWAISFVWAGNGFQNPVDPLPDDNLLDFDTAWFRGELMDDAGWGSWVNHEQQASLSAGAHKNPSPDAKNGTAVQWDSTTGCQPEEHCLISTVVAAPQPHNLLKFSWWSVVIHLDTYQALIYGCPNAVCSTAVLVWIQDASYKTPAWNQSGTLLYETAVSYPFYKIELSCRYNIDAEAGCKATGIYFSVEYDPNRMPPTPTPYPDFMNKIYLPFLSSPPLTFGAFKG